MRDCCSNCPCITRCDEPSPSAIERLYSVQSGDKILSGCDWTINSIDHNHCFWEYAKTLDAPVADKEICALLGITQQQLREVYASGIKKLKNNANDPVIKEFFESVRDKIIEENSRDDTSFLVEHMRAAVDSMPLSSSEGEPVEKGKPGRKPKSMPTHRDGRKVDIYFAKKNKPKF